jgi:DNA-binding transcriptional MerR regulator
MKIGTFAQKFNLNTSTIRFYIDNGLLTPTRKGGQYSFDKECVADMEKILKYKKYYFSLEEIQLLFFLEKASRFQDEIVLEVCADMMRNKRDSLIQERDKLAQCIDEIEKEIEQLQDFAPVDAAPAGVPFLFIPYLYCPSCQVPLRLDSASLSKGNIQKGILSCECSYSATITDGIILCQDFSEDTPFRAFENVESVMAMKDQFSPTYRKLITKAYVWMYHRIMGSLNEGTFFMTGPFTFNFLLEYIGKLGKNNTYIIMDPSLKRIRKLKKYLSSRDFTFVFVVGKPENIPIKRETVDFYIDDYSTVNCLFTYNSFSTDKISPLLKKRAEIVGIFTSYKRAPKSLQNFKKDHPDFSPEKMTFAGLKHSWKQSIKVTEAKNVGETTPGEKHFPYNAPGEVIEVCGYHAVKT